MVLQLQKSFFLLSNETIFLFIKIFNFLPQIDQRFSCEKLSFQQKALHIKNNKVTKEKSFLLLKEKMMECV